MSLKNKRILITAGPTWVPIDNVRVISNIATGRTGILLAEKLHRLGAKVTLFLGAVDSCCLNKKIRLIRFRFFDDLKDKLIRELKSKQYDAVIHSAAVSDYRPVISFKRKVRSGMKKWKLSLIPTPKIINLVKKIDPTLFLVGFKFQPQTSKQLLLGKAKELIKSANLDLAIANTIIEGRYKAYIIDGEHICGPITSRANLAKELISFMQKINY